MDSNDRLYGCDKKFLAEINKIVSTLMEAVFEHLKSLTSDEVSKPFASVYRRFYLENNCEKTVAHVSTAQ